MPGPDGTAIVAHSAESVGAVYRQLEANGFDLGRCCSSYIPDGTEADLGRAFAADEEAFEQSEKPLE